MEERYTKILHAAVRCAAISTPHNKEELCVKDSNSQTNIPTHVIPPTTHSEKWMNTDSSWVSSAGGCPSGGEKSKNTGSASHFS